MCPAGPIIFKDALRKSVEYSKTNTKLHFLLRPGYQKIIKNHYKCAPQGRFFLKMHYGNQQNQYKIAFFTKQIFNFTQKR